MSYGLPPACGSTSQPSQHRLPDANQDTHQDTTTESKLNPYARPFVPRRSTNKRSSDMPPTIRDRRTVAHSAPFSQRPQPLTDKQTPEAAREKIDQAYSALKSQHFSDAENTFQALLQEYEGQLSQAHYYSSVIGLARSLNEQNREKQKKAYRRLEQLRSNAPLTALRASTIHNLDLTLSRCEQALGAFPAAEERLLRLRNINPDADEEILCQPSNNFDADMTNARLWQLMKKHQMTETLLMNMKEGLTKKLVLNRSTATAQKLLKRLQMVNIAMMRLLQENGLYEWAEELLLNMSRKPSNSSEERLCQACGDNEIDLALVRVWQLMGKYKQAEKLLLNMCHKHPDDSEEILCTHSGNRDIDLTLMRHWQFMDKHRLAENLLLDMTGKHPNASEEILCRHSGRLDIDILLARHWESIGKYHLAERLLLSISGKQLNDTIEKLCELTENRELDLSLARLWQILDKFELAEKMLLNISGKQPNQNEAFLCQPCGVEEIDLALVRCWEYMGQYKIAEKLLLNMVGKQPNQDEEYLCQPCGNHLLDLALARLWQAMGNYERTERLLLNMCGKHPSDNEKYLCEPSGNKEVDLALARNWEKQGKHALNERLLLNMSGKSPFANEEELCKPSGDFTIDLTLARYWGSAGEYKWSEKLLLNMSGMGKHPKAPEELLCKPCGHYLIDIALVRIWEDMGEYKQSEKLLLNMSGKHPDNDEEDLCKPCGKHDIDLALVLLWQMMDKNEQAEKLINHCCDLYHTSEFELALLGTYAGTTRFMEIMTGYQESADTLLLTSIHYFRLAAQQITDNNPESGQDNLKKALEYAESVLGQYPGNAGACSQKAHCLRMMNYSEDVWGEWFEKAKTLDPGRAEKFKGYMVWRIIEAQAIHKVKGLARQTHRRREPKYSNTSGF